MSSTIGSAALFANYGNLPGRLSISSPVTQIDLVDFLDEFCVRDAQSLRNKDDYLDHEPDPATDVLLLVEVSNAILKGDTTVKARIYARHGLPEYWVVAIANRELIVYRQPTESGYARIQVYGENDSVAPLAALGGFVRLVDLLPSGKI